MFAGGRCLRLQIECEDFARDKIPEWQFQWFIDIVSYLQFITGDTVSTLESHRDKVQSVKARKTK